MTCPTTRTDPPAGRSTAPWRQARWATLAGPVMGCRGLVEDGDVRALVCMDGDGWWCWGAWRAGEMVGRGRATTEAGACLDAETAADAARGL
jgi:hypothetical protein